MSIAAPNYHKFFEEIFKNEMVFTIEDDGGIPTPMTHKGKSAMPFWSLKSRAEKIIKNVPAYQGFRVKEISLKDFIEKWLTGLSKDELNVGVNWAGPRAVGYDVKPNELKITLENYDSLNRSQSEKKYRSREKKDD